MVIINKQIKPPSSSAIELHCKSSEGNVYKMILQVFPESSREVLLGQSMNVIRGPCRNAL